MRLVRYIAVVYAGAILLTILGLVVIIVGASLVEGSGTYVQANASAVTVLEIAGYRAAGFAYQIVPAATLLGAVIAGTALARRGELLGIQAAGIGASRVWSALIGVSALFAVATALAGELVVPWTITAMERSQHENLGRNDEATNFYNRPVQWFRRNDLVLYLPAADLQHARFAKPVVYRIVHGALQTVFEADALVHDGTRFSLENARVLDVATSTFTHATSYPLTLDATPAALADIVGDPRQMRLMQIVELAHRRTTAGFDATAHLVELHSRLSHPLNAVWLTLVCAPWALHIDRKRSLAVNLGMGVVAIAVLLTLMYTFRTLALSHHISAAMGAWALSFSILASMPASFWLYRHLRAA